MNKIWLILISFVTMGLFFGWSVLVWWLGLPMWGTILGFLLLFILLSTLITFVIAYTNVRETKKEQEISD